MAKMLKIFCAGCLLLSLCSYADAGAWDECKGCHDGGLAPNAKDLKDKYRNAEKFVKAAKDTNEPLMSRFKKNESLLKEAAKDIGLK
jgi:hypothetical protein